MMRRQGAGRMRLPLAPATSSPSSYRLIQRMHLVSKVLTDLTAEVKKSLDFLLLLVD
jgi:hypothetical protein